MSNGTIRPFDARRGEDRRQEGRREEERYPGGQMQGQALLELRAILENATVGILFTRNRLLVRGNPTFAQMFGYTEHAFVSLPGRALYPSDAAFEAMGAEAGPMLAAGLPYRTEAEMRRQDGSLFWCRMSAKAIEPRRPQDGTIWIMEDITQERAQREALVQAHDELEQRVAERTEELSAANAKLQQEVFERLQAEQRVWHMAHHDALTGLPNRALLQDRLAQALAQAERNGTRAAVMFLDLDRFKTINDTLGHEVGDELLKEVARRLRAAVRAVDTVARLGGDEFVVVLHELAEVDDAARVAEKIVAAFAPPVNIGKHELRASTSVGIGLYPEDGADVVTLMKAADTAMYCAKHDGRNRFRFFSDRLSDTSRRHADLESRLAAALETGQFGLAWQAQIDFARRAVCGFQALLRWHDPLEGTIEAEDLMPLAGECELIQPIGAWALRAALEQNRRWQDAGRPLLPVSLSLSPRQFRHRDLVGSIRSILAETGQPARLLELGIGEGALAQDAEAARARLQELASLGVRLAIDDFGSGYANLIALKRYPIDRLKIGRGFVHELCTDAEDAAIVSVLLGIGRGLGLEVLADGVDTVAQRDALLALGCRHFQGRLFGNPLSPLDDAALFAPSGL